MKYLRTCSVCTNLHWSYHYWSCNKCRGIRPKVKNEFEREWEFWKASFEIAGEIVARAVRRAAK